MHTKIDPQNTMISNHSKISVKKFSVRVRRCKGSRRDKRAVLCKGRTGTRAVQSAAAALHQFERTQNDVSRSKGLHAVPMRKRPYEQLIAWKEAHALCKRIYVLTKHFPSEERFGMTSQMRRSSYSVPMNIVEGNGRRSKKERVHFIDIATGSLEELHYQCLLAQELGYLTCEQLLEIDDPLQRVGFLLTRLRSSLL